MSEKTNIRSSKILELKNFGFSFPGEPPVLEGLTWAVEEGAFILLTGKTGVGKTTLLRSLKPEIAPNGIASGSLTLFGKDIAEMSHEESAARIGYVFQSPEAQIVCDTVWHELAFGLENLGIERDIMRRRIAEVAQFFGIESWMERRTDSLSGGQKQILNLASILVMQPRLLLLDEPTAQLDPVIEKNFLHALFRVNRELGITVVVSTHSAEAMDDYATGCSLLTEHGILTCELAESAEDASVNPTISASSTDSGTPLGSAALEAPISPTDPGIPIRSEILTDPEAPIASTASGCSASSPERVLSVRDLWFRYQKDAPHVLRSADIEVEQGSIHAIVGGNGSGKTTLLRLMAQVLKPEHGSVKNALAEHQALLPQDPKALFVCDSVRDELLEWQKRCGYTEADVDAMLERFSLEKQDHQHPYDTSGGQQQKIALAKMLLTDPELLFMDEPTKGLDHDFRSEMVEVFETLRSEGKTIVLVTHDLSFVAAVADKVSMLFDGEIVCTESPTEFFENNIFYRPAYKLKRREQKANGNDR